jgi:hypothetical protein
MGEHGIAYLRSRQALKRAGAALKDAEFILPSALGTFQGPLIGNLRGLL